MSLVNKSLSIFNREIVFTFLRLGTGAIVARKLGPTGMGIWAALDLIVNYSRVFGAPRLEIATVYFWSQKQWNRGEILFTVNVVGFTMGLLLCFLLSFQHDLLRTFFVKTNIEPLLMILVFAHLPLRFVKRNYHYFLLAQEDTQSYNRVLVIDDVLKAMITITLLLFFDLGLWSLAIAIHISSACAFVYAAVKVRRTQRMVVHHNVKLFFTMLRFSMKVYVSEASGFLTIYISNLITALFLGPAQLAFFSMGKGKAEWLNRITNAIATVLYPRVSHLQGSGQDASITTTDASRISLLILSVAAFFLSLFIYPATLLLYGREFSPLVIVFFLILPGFIFHSVTSLQRQYFLGIGRADIPMKINMIPLILQATLCYLFIPKMGFMGGAIAVSLTHLMMSAITVIVYRRMTGITFSQLLLPTRRDRDYLVQLVMTKLQIFFDMLRRMFGRVLQSLYEKV